MKKRISAFFLIISIIVSCYLFVSCAKTPYERVEFALGTIIDVKILDGKFGSDFKRAMDEAFQRLHEIEKIASAKLSDSELSYVNDNAFHEEVVLSDELFGLLETGMRFSSLTDGAFDITLGRLIKLWGIGEEDAENEIPSEEEIDNAKNLCGYENLILNDDDPDRKTVRFLKNLRIDLGAVAKGYAADEMKRILTENGITEAILDLGGNVALIGNKNGNGYLVGIIDPRKVGGNCGIMELSDKTAVTSGDYERYFIDEETGKRFHHIFDRKTGYPAESGLMSVTVVSDISVYADALSTACFVLGREKSEKLIDRLKNEGIEVGAAFISDNSEIAVTKDIESYFKKQQ